VDWTAIRRDARANVQRTFAINGRYFSTLNVGPGAPCSVRLRSKVVTIGDLSSEGFSRQLDDTVIAVFWRTEAFTLGITKGGFIVMEDRRQFRLVNRNAVVDDITVEYQVVRA